MKLPLLPLRWSLAGAVVLSLPGWLPAETVAMGGGAWNGSDWLPWLAAAVVLLLVRGFWLRRRAGSRHSLRDRHELMVAHANIAMIVVAADTGIIVEANRQASELLGWPESELAGMNHTRIHPPTEEEAVRARFAERGRTEGFRSVDLSLQHKSGERIPVELRSSVFAAGGRRLVLGVFRDRRARLETQEELRDSERRFRMLFEHTPVAILEQDFTEVGAWLEELRGAGVTDLADYLAKHPGVLEQQRRRIRFKGLNRTALTMVGLTDLESFTQRAPEMATAEILEAFRQSMEALWQGRTRRVGELSYQDAAGRQRHCMMHWTAAQKNGVPDLSQVLLVLVDLSELRQTEARLQVSEDRWQLAMQATDDGIWDYDFRSGAAFYSDRSKRLIGFEPGELAAPTQRDWTSRIHPDDAARAQAAMEAHLRKETDSYTVEFRMRCKDGSYKWLLSRGRVLFGADGKPVRALGFHSDISGRKRAEEALRESEERYRGLFEGAAEGVFQSSPDGRFLRVNPSLARIFHCAGPEELMTWVGAAVAGLYVKPGRREEFFAALGARSSVVDFESEVRARNGAVKWISENVQAVRDAQGRLLYLQGFVTDITERKHAVEALRESEARLRQVVSQADCLMWRARVTEDEAGLHWRYELLPSSSRNSLRRLAGSRPPVDKIWPDERLPDLAESRMRGEQAVRSGAPGYRHEFRVINDGRTSWVAESVEVTSSGPGAWDLVGVCVDVTENKRSEERYRQLFAINPLPMWVFDRETLGFLAVNEAARRHYGYADEDFSHLTLRDIRPQEDVPRLEEVARTLGDGLMQSGVWRHRKKNGELILVNVDTHPIRWGGRAASLSSLRDVTEQVRATGALQASEERHRMLFEHAPVAIINLDVSAVVAWLDGLRAAGVKDLSAHLSAHPEEARAVVEKIRPISTNAALLRLVKAKSREHYFAERRKLYLPHTLMMLQKAAELVWNGRDTIEGETEMLDLAGERRQVHYRWWGSRTHPDQTVLALMDLTELKRAEAELAAGKERLAVTLRAMTEGVITFDREGAVQFINRAAENLTQWAQGSAVGRPVGEVCVLQQEKTRQPVAATGPDALTGGRVFDLPAETVLLNRRGEPCAVEGRCAPIYDAQGEPLGAVLVLRDVSEKHRLESEMRRASKLESVGVLAGGIAHDFNNILTAVMGSLTLAMMDAQAFASAGKWLREAERAAMRARDLTQQLLTFAKGGEPVRSAVRLPEVVREVAEFALHGSKVRCDYRISEGLWTADADKGQIGQVVQNLVINAAQAMPGGGMITLTLGNADESTRPAVLAPGKYLKFSIADTGTGIKPEHLAKIFDPYFTTKQQGSGLGLATVYSIIRKHEGHIEVESEPGRGTTFHLWLPAAHETQAEKAESRAPFAFGSGRVLFMDDEEPIRRMASTLLGRMGFEVVVVPDGAEALARYGEARDGGHPFDVVVMDLTVPGGMGGREAMEKLLALDPQVKAVVSSGYSSDPVMANHRAHGFVGMVAKPYRITDLASVLQKLIAQPSRPGEK